MIVMGDNDLAADQGNILARTRECGAGLASLRDEHLNILGNIRNEEENLRNTGQEPREAGLEERIGAVTQQLHLLEVGVAESGVMLSLASHFDSLEAERSLAKMEMRRVKDENDWLREELEDTERRLEEALSRLAVVEEEKKQWLFMEQVRRTEQEADLRPVTPSKIPVGAFRVEEEKAINRALTGGAADSNRQKSPPPPAPVSRIPKFSAKLGANYRRVQDMMEKAANERQEKNLKLRGKRHKLSLTPATSHSVIPSRWREAGGSPSPSLLPPPSSHLPLPSSSASYPSTSYPNSYLVKKNMERKSYQRNQSVPRDFVIKQMKGHF